MIALGEKRYSILRKGSTNVVVGEGFCSEPQSLGTLNKIFVL